MNNQELIKEFNSILSEMSAILQAKNSDYSDQKDAFSNFTNVEKLNITTAERGILVRMTDKITRICNLIDKDPAVKDEAIEDTLMDLANYSVILLAYIRNKTR